ncbi:MAG: hypothetical protein JO249_13340 [Acidobacteria bacterium]|nr:hypothetical protein [Acidobacteriota bacterium]
MPIHMGIVCGACGAVHFVATSAAIELSSAIDGMYRLTCQPPCSSTRQFRKDEMRPYRVSEDVFNSGYATQGEYEDLDNYWTGAA